MALFSNRTVTGNQPSPAQSSGIKAAAGLLAVVSAMIDPAGSRGPSPLEIERRFAGLLATARRDLAAEPEALQTALRRLHDEHIAELALLAGARADMLLSRELGGYQSTIGRVRSGAIFAANREILPADASPAEVAALKSSYEDMLYEDLLADLAELPGLY